MKYEKKLNKSALMIYKIFEEDPFGSYSVDDMIELADKNCCAMSKRTIFRAIEKLVDLRRIYCAGIFEGHRRYQLSNTGSLDLICNQCGAQVSHRMMQQTQLAAVISERYNFDILGFKAEYYGSCSCAKS